MIVNHKYPLNMVDHIGFRRCSNSLYPDFKGIKVKKGVGWKMFRRGTNLGLFSPVTCGLAAIKKRVHGCDSTLY